MKNKLITSALFVGSILLAGTAFAQDDTTTPPAVDPHVGPLHELRLQFRQQRIDMLQDFMEARQALRERLKNATEEERQAILQEFRALHRDRIEAERELRRAFREQVRELRRNRRNTPPGD